MHTARYATDDNREVLFLCTDLQLAENLSLSIELDAVPLSGVSTTSNKHICKKLDCFRCFSKKRNPDVFTIYIFYGMLYIPATKLRSLN